MRDETISAVWKRVTGMDSLIVDGAVESPEGVLYFILENLRNVVCANETAQTTTLVRTVALVVHCTALHCNQSRAMSSEKYHQRMSSENDL